MSKPALRLLSALAEEKASAIPDPIREDAVVVRSRSGPVSLGRGVHLLSSVDELRRRDLVETAGEDRGLTISAAGRGYLKRHAARGSDDVFQAQHGERADTEIQDGPSRLRVTMNAAESPLDWLRRRRDGSGEPLIDAVDHEAGERLRRDLTLAGMLPAVTSRWDGAIGSGRSGARDPAGAADAVIAARQRVRAALASVGGDFADLLVDLCGFLKGLELIELERRWPPRSAKVVVRLALRRLAEHYGYERETSGPGASRGIRVWRLQGETGTDPEITL